MTVPQVLHPFAAPTRQAGDFLEIVRGEGCRLWDSDGHVYLDGTASLWYCAVGHGRREIAHAVAAQMEQVAAYHTFASFTNGPEQRLAELLMELETRAADAGYRRAVLETGTEQPEALALYPSAGWQSIPGYGHYKWSPRNRCFAKELTQQ